jgi:hypothetical protein
VNNWKVIFATVVIFGAGVVTGGLLVDYVGHSYQKNSPKHSAATAEVHHSATNQPPRQAEAVKLRLPEILNKPFLQRLDEELRLTPDQHEAIQKIINDGQNQMRKVVQDARLEIREVLTPEQRKQFDELVKRPFRKSLFDTNASAGAELDFKNRLEKIVALQRIGSNLSPEAQVITIEAERAAGKANLRPPP